MSEDTEPLPEGTLISHLLELRKRLLRAFIAVLICFLPCAYYVQSAVRLAVAAAGVEAAGGTEADRDHRHRHLHRAAEAGVRRRVC